MTEFAGQALLRLGDANSCRLPRLPACQPLSFIISVDKTEAHGPGLTMETHTSDITRAAAALLGVLAQARWSNPVEQILGIFLPSVNSFNDVVVINLLSWLFIKRNKCFLY